MVTEEGGFNACCHERKWTKIAARLNYAMGKNIGTTLRQHYEKVLYPYDLFHDGVTVDTEVSSKIIGHASHMWKYVFFVDFENAHI